MRSPDLFTPPPVAMPDWKELYWRRRETKYRWRVVPGTPLKNLEAGTAPEGFCLEFWGAQAPATGSGGWTPVRFYRIRNEIWVWLQRKGEVPNG